MEARQLATVGLAAHPGVGAAHAEVVKALTSTETYAVVGLRNATSAPITVEILGAGFEPRRINLAATVPGRPAASATAVYVPHKREHAPVTFEFKFDSAVTGRPRKEVVVKIRMHGIATVPKGQKPTVGSAPVFSFQVANGAITLR